MCINVDFMSIVALRNTFAVILHHYTSNLQFTVL